MSQHFLLSAKARTLSLSAVLRMGDEEVEAAFVRIRWHATAGKPVCPHCECPTVYDCRKANGAPRWRCKACRKDFSVTSGTLFAFHKMPLRNYLAAIAIFCNEVKGKSALALSRDLDCQYKTAFVLAHKLREAMAAELKGMQLGGAGETVEIDGGYFGGYVKPANFKENRRDRRLAKNQNGKRQVVVVMRERGGSTLPAVFKSESAALGWISSHVSRETRLIADEAGSWNDLHARYAMDRIDHSAVYSLPGGIYSNGAESFFSRMRRGEIGHHHHVAGAYLVRYAQESAWREDHRRVDNGRQVQAVMGLAAHSDEVGR
jgi:transposase-like protein